MFVENSEIPPPGSSPALGGTSVALRETDAERIAFRLWNEGRIDEAIAFLEREIAAERDRKRGAEPDTESGLPVLEVQLDGVAVEPVSDWRKRHRTALSPADFNAFGASAATVDLVAKPADAILPHESRRSFRPAWVMGLGLAAVLGVSAAAFWNGRDDVPDATAFVALPGALPAADATGAAIAPAAIAEAGADLAAVDDLEAIAESDAGTAATPPPEDEVALEGTELDPPVETWAASAPAGLAPETTASIAPQPAAAEPPAIVEARLPRQRPEPPANVPLTFEARVAPAVPEVAVPEVYVPPSVPVYTLITPPRSPVYDPANPPTRLTPAEYQALLERRAWAQNYTAQRRAFAEQRALGEPRVFYDIRRP